MPGQNERKFSQLTEDYATEPVPYGKTVSGLRIGLVLAGIGIALPALLTGSEIGGALGLTQGLIAFFIAGAFVTALGLVTGLVGSGTRLSTYMIIQFSFGRVGSKAVNIAFALSQFGWFGVNVYLFGAAAQSAGEPFFPGLGANFYIVLGGILMTVSTIFGFKALDKLALFAVPLLMVTLVVMITQTLGTEPLGDILARTGSGELTLSKAISVLAGGIMVGVVLLPDLTRYSRSSRDTLIAVLISLALVEPLVHTAAAIPSIAFAQTDVLAILLAVGFGGYALFVLIFTSWTTNAVNLYGSGLALTAVFPRFEEWRIIALSGVVGTAIAFFDVPELFIGFLYYQALIFTPVVGIYVTDYFIVRKRRYDLATLEATPAIGWPAVAAWVVGTGLAYLAGEDYVSLTTIPALDAAIASAVVYLGLSKAAGHMRRAT